MNNRAITILIIASLILVGFAVYVNSWSGSFHFDDYVYIVEKEAIRDLGNIKAIWQSLGVPRRFIGMYSFAVNYHFSGTSVRGYHVVNTILHILTSIIVFLFAQQFLYLHKFSLNRRTQVPWIAAMTAFLFLVHPINSQPVNYICQRFAIWATLFYVATLYFYLLGRRRSPWFFVGAVLCGIGGFFSKAIIFTLPLMIIGMEGILISKKSFKSIFRIKWVWLLLLTLLIIPGMSGFSIVTYMYKAQFDSWSHIGDTISSMSYFLTQPKVIVHYLWLFIAPVKLNLLHDVTTTKSILEPFFLVCVSLILGLGYVAYRVRKIAPVVTFGVIWFYLTLAVESSFLPLRHVMFEHRCYLPSVGVFLASAYLWNKYIQAKHFKIISAVVCLSVLTVLTFQRNQVWHDEVSLWSDVIKKSPGLTSPYTHRGMSYMRLGKDKLAMNDFNQAIANHPSNGELLNNRGNLYLKHRLYDQALRDYDEALQLDPTLERTYSNRGVIYKIKKQYARALADYNKALEINPRNATTRYNKGNIYRAQQKWYSALDEYSKAIENNPQHIKSYFNRSQIYFQLGRLEEARADARMASQLGMVLPKEYQEALK